MRVGLVVAQGVALSWLAFASCGPPDSDGGRAPEPASEDSTADADAASAAAEVERSGTIAVTGSQPVQRTILTDENGESVSLMGGATDELARLTGAVVTVRGTAGGGPMGPAIEVMSYNVDSVDGAVPRVGVLTEEGGSYWLTGEPPVRLHEPPESMTGEVGALLWVTGSDDDGMMRVQSYGVIRPQPP